LPGEFYSYAVEGFPALEMHIVETEAFAGWLAAVVEE